jgi:phasin family protein
MANPYADMMKYWGDFTKTPQMPASFDINQVMHVGRKNAEAATAAGQTFVESFQTIARRQAELTRSQVESALKTTKDMLVNNGSPEINTSKHIEFAKRQFETSLNNLREVSELATKAGFEVFDVINRRASQTIEELAGATKQANGTAGTRTSKKNG